MINNTLNDFSVKEKIGISIGYETTNIKIYDAIMGSGKTTKAIECMKKYVELGQKFIFVTPFLKEVQRVLDEIGNDYVVTPEPIIELVGSGFYINNEEPANPEYEINRKFKRINKREHFIKLLKKGFNIATTHSLYTSLFIGDASLFKDYILIIDESINPISTFNFGARDIKILFNENLISQNAKTNKIAVTDVHYKDDSFKEILNFCNQDNVYLINNVFVSMLPMEIIKAFKEVQILTYLFENSLMAYYFKWHNIKYRFHRVFDEKLIKEQIRKKLNIYEGSRNQKHNTHLTQYSKNFLNKQSKQQIRKIKESVKYVFRYEFQTNSHENSFTTFKEVKVKYAGRGYTRGFIPVNARATNEFSHKKSMAYIANRYLNPAIKNLFKDNNILINEDDWALSELIQWVWRGCIRNNQKMNLYIPSNRMRNLLINWLNK
jgi:hypothetical protein